MSHTKWKNKPNFKKRIEFAIFTPIHETKPIFTRTISVFCLQRKHFTTLFFVKKQRISKFLSTNSSTRKTCARIHRLPEFCACIHVHSTQFSNKLNEHIENGAIKALHQYGACSIEPVSWWSTDKQVSKFAVRR